MENVTFLAAYRQDLDHGVIETLLKDRCDERFELLWSNLLMEKQTPNCRVKEGYLSFLIHKIKFTKFLP